MSCCLVAPWVPPLHQAASSGRPAPDGQPAIGATASRMGAILTAYRALGLRAQIDFRAEQIGFLQAKIDQLPRPIRAGGPGLHRSADVHLAQSAVRGGAG